MAAGRNSAATFIKYWLPVIIYAILIFYVSSLPGQKIPKLFRAQSALFHISEYAIFALLLSRALKAYYPGLNFRRRFFWVIFLSVAYALSDEFHQAFVPNRNVSLVDVLFDGIGAFVANIFYR